MFAKAKYPYEYLYEWINGIYYPRSREDGYPPTSLLCKI